MTGAPKDPRPFAAVSVGDQPLVPPEIQQCGTALEVALAAIARLADLKRPRAPIRHRKAHPKACSGPPYNVETET